MKTRTSENERLNIIKKNLKKTSLPHLLDARVRSRIKWAFKRAGFEKNMRDMDIIGISMKDYAVYIESKFEKGMSIETKDTWHIDHRIPLATARSREELIRLLHYTNTRPMWIKDNLIKGSAVPEEKFEHKTMLLNYISILVP